MAFNKDDFLAAFLERAATGIERRGEEARQYEQEQKAAAQRDYQLVTKRKQTAEQAAQLGKRLMAMGVGKGQVLTAMSSGMGGIQELYDKISAATQQRGVKTLGQDDIAALVEMPALPALQAQYQDMDKVDLNQFAAQTYGAVGKAAPPPQQAGLMASLLGFGGRERVDAKLAAQQFGGGMSYADINAAARNSDYQSMFGEATMTFTDVEYFDPKAANKFVSDITSVASEALKTPAAQLLITEERNRAIRAGEDALEAVKKAQQVVIKGAVTPYIQMAAQTYANGNFFGNTYAMDVIKKYAGEDYLKKLRGDYLEDDDDGIDDGMEDGGDNGGAGANEGDNQPKVKTNEDLLAEPETPATPDDPFPPAPALDEEGKAVVKDALSSRSIFSDAEDKYTDLYTKDQWEKMSRKQRRERGLPESPLGAMNFYFRDDIMEMIEAPAKNLQIKRNIDKPVYKINIKGRGTYHVTAEQLESIDDSYFRGSKPAIIIEEYGEDEKKAKNITKPVLKAIGVE